MKTWIKAPDARPARPSTRTGDDPTGGASWSLHAIIGRALCGVGLAILIWLGMGTLRLGLLLHFVESPVFALALSLLCAGLFVFGRDGLPLMLAVLVGLPLALILFTPVIEGPARSLVVRDPVRHGDAVVVLSSGIHSDGTLESGGYSRAMQGLELVSEGYAGRMIVTRLPPPDPSSIPDIQRQCRAFHLTVPLMEVGPVTNTHDEALEVAHLARLHHWKSILLVTSPLHTHRAAAVFRKAGLIVCVQPSPERGFDLNNMSPLDHLQAFGQWIREVAAWQVYRRRGWV